MGNICRFQKKCCNVCLREGMTVSHTNNIHWLVKNDIVSSVQWIWVWLCIMYCVKHKAYQQAAKAVKASFINGTVGPADCAQYDLRQQSCMHDTWTHNWSSMQLKTPTYFHDGRIRLAWLPPPTTRSIRMIFGVLGFKCLRKHPQQLISICL